MNNEDLKIVHAFKLGNRDEFIKLYDKYLKQIYNFIYYKTSHKETAEDLTSQTFLKALRKLTDFQEKEDASLSAWLFTIARNNVSDYYRSYKANKDIDDVWDLAADEDVNSDLEFKERSLWLRKYLKDLKSNQREIIILRIFQDLSYQEISEIYGKSENACKMEFSRALKTLKEKMPLEALVLLLTFSIK